MEKIGMREELIGEAHSLAMKAYGSTGKQKYVVKKISGSSAVVFAFGGSWAVNDWFSEEAAFFGETEIDLSLFPSLRSIGNNEPAMVNKASLDIFQKVRKETPLQAEVEKVVKDKRQIVFAGHSSGGSVAIFATLWFLEKYIRPDGNQILPPHCVTFGSPLVGNRILSHALRREKWARYFIHFVMEYDIVPRIMLAPLSSIEQELQPILHFLDEKVKCNASHQPPKEAFDFFVNVMRNASAVTSHVACDLMESTNSLFGGSLSQSGYIKVSPYRPFGTYIFFFCSGKGKPLVVENNPDAVLQMLFYFSQLSCEAEGDVIAVRSLNENMGYEKELKDNFKMQNLVDYNDLKKELLSSTGRPSGEVATMNKALFELSKKARLCLAAAEEAEKRKMENEEEIDKKKVAMEGYLTKIQKYQTQWAKGKVGYYDAFKLQKNLEDAMANMNRLELAKIWDEIKDMLKMYELPDEFESRGDWVKLGTEYRRLVEPLDIANYYRHLKGYDTRTYLGDQGRPKRYRYTQRWYEQANRMPFLPLSESCFLAEVEELKKKVEDLKEKTFEEVKDEIVSIEKQVSKWVDEKVLGKDVFLEESTFSKWWKSHPEQHRSESVLGKYMSN